MPSTIHLLQHIQQEILEPTLCQIQPYLIAIDSTLRHNFKTAKPKEFEIFASANLHRHNNILKLKQKETITIISYKRKILDHQSLGP